MPKNEEMKHFTVFLTHDLYFKFKLKTVLDHSTMADRIRKLIADYVSDEAVDNIVKETQTTYSPTTKKRAKIVKK